MDPRYPIGKFEWKGGFIAEERKHAIETIAGTPGRMREAVRNLSPTQLDTPYREGGWTVRQVVHHVPDSHLNAYVRLKLALTEEVPTIKTYEEALWAQLPDTALTPVEVSLALLESLHARWVTLMRSMSPSDWSKKFRHPQWGEVSLDWLLGLYAWHGNHHTAHVTALRERMGWK